MKKILLPIDGSPRSLRTIQEIKQSYDPKETEITILLVTPEPRPHKMTDDNDEVKPMPDHDEIKSVDENDAEVSRQLLASFARMMPEYKVDTALRFGNPGPEIIGFAKEGGFDAILMDVMMPVRDGHEATRAIRAMDRPDAKSIPIFAMTANAFAEDRLKALQAGMNEHLSKPIDPDTLYRLLVKYLTERS